MVTTRSADKRLDTSRGEDLVLRSRTIGSPSSVASTPSHSQKRTASSREKPDGLRSKRVRTETNGNVSAKTTHIVVNVPIIAIGRENRSVPDGVTKSSGLEAEFKTTHDDDRTETDEDRDQATPNAKVTTAAETPDQGGETFQTPATSRHKRFGSEEPDDDTVIVSTTIDSSAPQGYHTAEEEIADSDNDDEAPDVESTKIAPRLPQRKSGRTARAKKEAANALNTVDVDDETIEVRSSHTRTESELLVVEKELPVSEDGLGQGTSVKKPGQEILNANPVPSTLESVHSQTTIESQPSVPTTLPIQLSGGTTSTSTEQRRVLPPSEHQEIGSAEDADIDSVTVSDSSLQNLSLTKRKTHNRFFPHILGRSTQLQSQSSELTPIPKAVQLPAKATSGLSDYRRRKFQQKVAGSAGGFKMQTDWPKKRSSFVVS